MAKVLNKHHGYIPSDAVYIGRPSKWGNPFSHISAASLAKYHVETRDQAVDKFYWWITLGDGRYLLPDLEELRGKDLVCFCKPKRCHGDILLVLANG